MSKKDKNNENNIIKFNDPRGMLISINTFKQISIDVFNNYYKNKYYGYIDACLVNASFSIEVGLKYLVGYDEGKYEKGHLWIYYWNKLNKCYKNCIIFFLNKTCKNKYNNDFINKSINEFSNTFSYLRYSFEKNVTSCNPKMILELMYAIAFVANYRDENNEKDYNKFQLDCLTKIQKEDHIEIQLQ